MAENSIKILEATIKLNNDYLSIDKLKFMKDNPRVYSCIHDEPGFDNLHEEEQQEKIFENLKKEPSVRNLISEVERHGGLMEQILVRLDTMEVIEGNSRLAVYRILHKKTGNEDWEFIPCNIVSSLTDKQQIAFLNQIHVKGKTKWSAYEKANFAYVRKEQKWILNDIADLFGESSGTINTRIKAIEMMRESNDRDRSHFSYYDVLYRYIKPEGKLRNVLFERIKNLGNADDGEDLAFTAQDIRKKLPVIMLKPKVLKKYIEGSDDLDTAYQRAEVSNVQQKIRKAMAILEGIERKNITVLSKNDLNALDQSFGKLTKETKRIKGIIKQAEKKNEYGKE